MHYNKDNNDNNVHCKITGTKSGIVALIVQP